MSSAASTMRRNQNLTRAGGKGHMGPVSMTFVSIAIISVLALLYLTQITKTSVFGYKLSELNAKQTKLVQAHQELQVEAARLQSVKNIQASSAAQKLTAEKTVTYAHE